MFFASLEVRRYLFWLEKSTFPHGIWSQRWPTADARWNLQGRAPFENYSFSLEESLVLISTLVLRSRGKKKSEFSFANVIEIYLIFSISLFYSLSACEMPSFIIKVVPKSLMCFVWLWCMIERVTISLVKGNLLASDILRAELSIWHEKGQRSIGVSTYEAYPQNATVLKENSDKYNLIVIGKTMTS